MIAEQQTRSEKWERNSTKSRMKCSKNSRASRTCTSTTSSSARALEAKAKEAELKRKVDQLDQVEAAKTEAERARLMAECTIAAAVSKVYEDAAKEDEEQYLGSDDPDNDNANPENRLTKESLFKSSVNSTTNQPKGALNLDAPELNLSSPKVLETGANTGWSSANRGADEYGGCAVTRNALRDVQANRKLAQNEQTLPQRETLCEPQTTFWESMELRLSSPHWCLLRLMATLPSTYGLEQIFGTKWNVRNLCLTLKI